jgi:hypothetical protein
MKPTASLMSCALAASALSAVAASSADPVGGNQPAKREVARVSARIVGQVKVENGHADAAGLPMRQRKRKVRCDLVAEDNGKNALCNEVLLEIE